MAEKKVGGKPKKNTTEYSSASRLQQAEYDAFLSEYGHGLRIRNTRTVPEPRKKRAETDDIKESRCVSIDPHTTVNPAAEHQIFTKRTGRILSDDTGFKAMSYNDRFALKPEMPEIDASQSEVAQGGFDDSSVPGQQTMADLVAGKTEEIAVPVEAKITEDANMFSQAYKIMRSEEGVNFGKSEKLRAIARTAADDAGMEPDSQLVFPAFAPLFGFPQEEKGKKKHLKKKNKKADKQEQSAVFDIEESNIVTSHTAQDAEKNEETKSAEEYAADKKYKAKRFFETINNAGLAEVDPAFEMTDKSDIRPTLQKLRKSLFTQLVKSAILAVMSIVLGIVSAVASDIAVVSIVFLLLAGVVCIRELADGIKDISKLKFSSYCAGGLLIYAFTLLQTITAAVSDESVKVLAPCGIFMMIMLTLPKMLLDDNAQTAVSIFADGKGVSLLKPLAESGIEGSVLSQHSADGKDVRYSVKTEFAAGLMKKLTNAIPAPFAGNTMFIFTVVFAVITGIAAGIRNGSFAGAVTGFDAMLICCLPVTYTLSAAALLFMADKKLAKNRTSIISYKSATALTRTKAVVLADNSIIDASACTVHGVKFYGHTDSKDAALCCAAVMNSADMPLAEIMKKVIEQGEEETEIPVADDYILNSKGVAAIYGSKRILLGTKEFLTENRVFVPDDDSEETHISGDRKLLYLAVNGEFCMLLVVSYHIKRNVSNFIKYLVKKDMNIIIHSADPNITAEYVEKKCKLKSGSVSVLNETETAYFKDKASKTETVLPAYMFTDGKIASVAQLFRAAYFLSASVNLLPVIIFALCVAAALAVAIPVISGSMWAAGNLYIIIIRLISLAVGAGIPVIACKDKQ